MSKSQLWGVQQCRSTTVPKLKMCSTVSKIEDIWKCRVLFANCWQFAWISRPRNQEENLTICWVNYLFRKIYDAAIGNFCLFNFPLFELIYLSLFGINLLNSFGMRQNGIQSNFRYCWTTFWFSALLYFGTVVLPRQMPTVHEFWNEFKKVVIKPTILKQAPVEPKKLSPKNFQKNYKTFLNFLPISNHQ